MAKKPADHSALQEFKDQLRAGEPRRLYVFRGEETYLMRKYLGELQKRLLDPVTESFNYHRFHGEHFSLSEFHDAVENLPMMADRTLVIVDDLPIFELDSSVRGNMAELIQDIPEYCTLVFVFETVPYKPEKDSSGLEQALKKNAFFVNFDKRDRSDLVDYVSAAFRREKKQISNALCGYLVDLTDGTLSALSAEVRKICAFSEASQICREDIDAVTEPTLDAVVFQMTDCLAKKDFGGALKKLQDLLKMQQEPLAILGAVGSHFRKLSAARMLSDRGKQAGELAQLYNMKPYPAQKMMDNARLFPPRFCARASELVMETDFRMKSSYGDSEELLTALVLRLGQEAGRG